MAYSERLCVVQLPHPGREHKVPTGGRRPWNTAREHRRTFLAAQGTWAAEPGQPGVASAVTFWGEWEGHAREVSRLRASQPGLPRSACRPELSQPPSSWRQNTDPYVFGPRFLYSNCRQTRQGRPTQLTRLAAGSLILFGSSPAEGFVLDTVFVVRGRVADFNGADRDEQLAGAISPTYRAATIDPLYSGPEAPHFSVDFRLYEAAMAGDGDGPHSFVPGLPYSDDGPAGFVRPLLEPTGLLSTFINSNLRMAAKLVDASPGQIHDLWQEVVRRVRRADLGLITSVQEPVR